MSKTYYITGVAGFVGAATAEKLLAEGHTVVGIDNLNDYYSPEFKKARIERIKQAEGSQNFTFEEVDLADMPALEASLKSANPSVIVNLAAQAGVRYSLENPAAYAQSNLVGFLNILECARKLKEENKAFEHLVYASSSSVYGGNDKFPFEETDRVDDPRSLYAASKRSNELMAHTYANLLNIPCTGLRFFTVYGPWGRPDMAPMLFAEKIMKGEPIKVFNEGDLWRDFTYIDDIVEGVCRVCNKIPEGEIPSDVFNIGNNQPVKLIDFIKALEKALDKEAILDMQPWPPTEVYKTFADTSKLDAAVGYKPNTDLDEGLSRMANWFKEWYLPNLVK